MNALRISAPALTSARRQPIATYGRQPSADAATRPSCRRSQATNAEQQALLTAHAAALGILGLLCVPS